MARRPVSVGEYVRVGGGGGGFLVSVMLDDVVVVLVEDVNSI